MKLLDGGRLSVYVERGEDKVPVVVRLAEAVGAAVTSVSLRRPSLEDVFLHLTGRELREEARPAKQWRPH